jgi:ankyrin repeat protein
MSESLFDAIYEENIEEIKVLLADPRIDVNAMDKYGAIPLIVAVSKGNIEIIKELLKHPNINVNAKNYKGNTTLFQAIHQGNIEIIKILLADPRININIRDGSEMTVKFWVKNNIQKKPGAGFEEILKLIEETLENPNEVVNEHGTTKLMMTSIDEMRRLLQHPKIDTNIQDNSGKSALSVATQNGQVDKIELLLDNQKTNVNIINKREKGTTAFHMLANYTIHHLLHNKKDIITRIIHAYKKRQAFEIDAVDDDGNTVLMRLIYLFYILGGLNDKKHTDKLLEVIKLFIEEGANPTIFNNNGETILDLSNKLPNSVKEEIQTLYATYLSKQ